MKKGKVDRPFVIALLILVGFGLLMVFSASMYSSTVDGSKGYSLFLKQFGFVALGLVVMGFMSNIDYRKYNNKKISMILLGVTVFLLLLVLVVFPWIPRKTADFFILAEMVIMFLTLILYIPEFQKLHKKWERRPL